MVDICSREECTGCAACLNICHKECINMVMDSEGFLRPAIDSKRCDDCGACRRICPTLHPVQTNSVSAMQCYACWNKDVMVRFQSASGGAFSAIASSILNTGGIVFGAAFDKNMRLNHIAVDGEEGLGRLRSSKYVQSDIGRVYFEIQKNLRQDRRILFSGTPCQVAALYALLGKDDKNVFTCDLLCYGVPSPGLFAKYVEYLEGRFRAKLVNINVRHKRKGWHMASTVAFFSDGQERVLTGYGNSFMYGFLNCLSLRPSCHQCAYTKVERSGDITLGDFWSIGTNAPFNHITKDGVSLVLVNSEKGRILFKESSSRLYFEERMLKEAKYNKTQLSHPLSKHMKREQFFIDYNYFGYAELARKYLVDKGVRGLIKSVVPRSWIFYLRKWIKQIFFRRS